MGTAGDHAVDPVWLDEKDDWKEDGLELLEGAACAGRQCKFEAASVAMNLPAEEGGRLVNSG